MESVWPKSSGTRDRPPPTILRVGKLGETFFLTMYIRMWAQVSFVLSQSTPLTGIHTDRQTDRRTDGQRGLGTVRCIIGSRTVESYHIQHQRYQTLFCSTTLNQCEDVSAPD